MFARAAIVAAVLWLAVCPAGAQQQQTSNLVSGSASAMGTGATTIIAAPSGPRRLYISSVACVRNDADTSVIYVRFNDERRPSNLRRRVRSRRFSAQPRALRATSK
jgi:hypothetical protein